MKTQMPTARQMHWFNLGAMAHGLDDLLEDNPHDDGTEASDFWSFGWCHARDVARKEAAKKGEK